MTLVYIILSLTSVLGSLWRKILRKIWELYMSVKASLICWRAKYDKAAGLSSEYGGYLRQFPGRCTKIKKPILRKKLIYVFGKKKFLYFRMTAYQAVRANFQRPHLKNKNTHHEKKFLKFRKKKVSLKNFFFFPQNNSPHFPTPTLK